MQALRLLYAGQEAREANMTKGELEMMLADVQPGEGMSVPYHDFDAIFPRGQAAQDTRPEAYDFAKTLGFKIDNRPDDDAVWFQRYA